MSLASAQSPPGANAADVAGTIKKEIAVHQMKTVIVFACDAESTGFEKIDACLLRRCHRDSPDENYSVRLGAIDRVSAHLPDVDFVIAPGLWWSSEEDRYFPTIEPALAYVSERMPRVAARLIKKLEA